jgi:hypothetical protein
MTIALKGLLAALAVLVPAAGAAMASEHFVPRHGVILEPGDVTPLHTRQGTLLGPTLPRPAEPPLRPRRDPVLDHELSRLESRAVAEPERDLPARQLERDLDVAGQRLRTRATDEPADAMVPHYQHRLDWIDRLQRRAAARLRAGQD